MGLFGPDWKTGNSYHLDKALAAVDSADPGILGEIARKAKLQEVAARAVDRMEPAELRDVVLSDGKGFYHALERLAELSRDEDLFYIAVHGNTGQKRNMAAASIGKPEVLARLMQAGDMDDPNHVSMYLGIGWNLNTPPDLLDRLSHSSNAEIRKQVVVNPSTPDETVIRLAEDKDIDMCRAILNRKELPEEVLKKMRYHPSEEIRYRAKYHFIEVEKGGKAKIRESMELLGIIK